MRGQFDMKLNHFKYHEMLLKIEMLLKTKHFKLQAK